MNLSDKAKLRDMTEADLEMVLDWRNQDFIRNMMFNSEKITIEEHKKWFQKMNHNQTSLMKIFEIDDNPYGVVSFHNINEVHKTSDWSFYIGDTNAPKGSGIILGEKALTYIFKEKKMRKLCAQVISSNQRSYRYHLKLGFKQEGCLRDHIYKQGSYQDVFLFAQFDTDWENKCLNC